RARVGERVRMFTRPSRLPQYRPSGRTSPRLIPAALLGCAIGVGLAYPYQAIVREVPFVLINLLIVAALAGLLAMLARKVSALGHNRVPWLGGLVGLLIATATIGASHYFAYRSAVVDVVEQVAKESNTTESEVKPLISSRLTFERYIEVRVESGWSLGRHADHVEQGDITGSLVWIVWGIEALVLLGACISRGARCPPYCEHCHEPLPEELLFQRSDLDLSDLGVITDARSSATLVDIPPRAPPTPACARVAYVTHACATCESDTYLTVSRVFTTGSSDSDERKTLHTEVVLERVHYNRLLVLRDQLSAVSEAHR
ncbi:MAG: hypothetical protein ACKV2T_14525, partial [Kofleriaceae bacterium]